MKITCIKITMYADWVRSLKEKRAEVKRVLAAVQNKFKCSVIEAGAQDSHKDIIIGIAFAAGSGALADSQKESVISFVENTARAEIIDVYAETRDFD